MTQRRFHRRQWLRNLFFVAAAGAVGVIAFGARGAQRMTLVALEADEAAALCSKENLPLADFWQRVEIMGVGGVIVREAPLAALSRRGKLLMFSREEAERWRAAGLVSPAAAIKPETVWTKDAAMADQLIQAGRRQGLAASSSTASGYHLVRFPESAVVAGSLDDARIGVYDPDLLKSLEGRRLARLSVPYAADDPASGQALFRWGQGGQPEGVPLAGPRYRSEQSTREALDGPVAQPEAAAEGRLLESRTIPVGASAQRLLKSVYSHPSRLLIVRLTEPGVEANVADLRAMLQELKRRGVPTALPAELPGARPPIELLQRRLIQMLLWLFGLFGPLLAARAGLVALKRVRVAAAAHWPVATPVVQLAAGIVAAALVATVVGLAARSCFDSMGILSPWREWARASLIVPLFIAALTLYTIDPEDWRRRLSAPMRWIHFIAVLAAGATMVCLLEPRRLLAVLHLGWLASLRWPALLPWWWDWRWREILVGWPCLLQAFFLINWRMDCPDCATLEGHALKDPRFWFLLGLLAPIGVVAAVGLEQMPREVALVQSGWSALAGLILGAALVALRLRWLHGTKDLEHHRTINLDVPA